MIIGVDFLLENPGIGEEYGELMKISHETSTPNAIKYEAEARISSILWNGLYSEEKVDEFIPILSMSYLPQIAKPKIDVYNVIFENIPIPHPETPIEHILEFRSNKDNEGRLLAFRSLVNKLGREDYTEIEIKQEIEHLMHQYKESLKT
ncbi:MAG: hypothetical protein IPP38_09985 [Bacteroidetes bacterium]|nr:hypothetical protein [Bacteroidota bacterium]